MVISSLASGLVEGKNQKYNSLDSLAAEDIGRRPAYDSPISKSTSGIPEPLTAYSKFLLGNGSPVEKTTHSLWWDSNTSHCSGASDADRGRGVVQVFLKQALTRALASFSQHVQDF